VKGLHKRIKRQAVGCGGKEGIATASDKHWGSKGRNNYQNTAIRQVVLGLSKQRTVCVLTDQRSLSVASRGSSFLYPCSSPLPWKMLSGPFFLTSHSFFSQQNLLKEEAQLPPVFFLFLLPNKAKHISGKEK
jgi:hypothetical protein